MSHLIYNLFLFLLYPFYRILILLSPRIRSFDTRRKNLREKVTTIPAGGLWLHASSVGEMDQAMALVRELKKRDPEGTVVLSYFSESAAREHMPEVDFVFPLPLDLPWTWKPFLKHLRPAAMITMTWDVFPNLLRSLEKAGIPSYLSCAALDSRSRRLRGIYRRLLIPVYSRFSGIGAVNEDQKRLFEKLVHDRDRVRVTGDSRYDTILYRVNNAKLKPETEAYFRTEPSDFWILGSTYAACDHEIFPGLLELRKKHPSFRFLVFPHFAEEERLQEIEKKAKEHSLKSRRWSQLLNREVSLEQAIKRTGESDLILVDRMGILALAYQFGAFAYVGGGFHHRIHNTGEPAALGLPILTGPRIDTSPVALELEATGCLHRFSDGKSLLEMADRLMGDETLRREKGEKGRRIIESGSGSAALFLDTFFR